MIGTIAAREFKSLFVSPLAWIALAILQFLFAYLFFSRIELFIQYLPRLRNLDASPGMTEIVAAGLFSIAGLVFLIITPLFCSRSLAEERRSGTLKLTLSSPVSLTELVLGKFIGLFCYFLIIIMLLSIMAFSLMLGGPVDIGQILTGLSGLVLLISVCIAIGLFMSSLTAQPTFAAISTFTLLFFMWIIKWDDKNIGMFATYLSLQEHFSSLISGVIASVDVIYFLLLTVLFLGLTIWRLDLERS